MVRASEHHRTSHLTAAQLAADVEAQIDFVEVPMKGHRNAKQPSVQEAEANDAHERAPLTQIQHRAAWDQGFQ
jgi:hypothetical protein